MFNVVNTLSVDKWRQFVDTHPQGNIFHTPEMFEVFNRTQNHTPTLWAVTGDNDQVLALMTPVEITLKTGVLRSLTTRAVVYGGILGETGTEGEKALDMLLDAYTNRPGHASLFTELRNLADTQAIQPILNKHGFFSEDHLNYLVDLRCSTMNFNESLEKVMEKIGRRTRKKIRHGLKQHDLIIQEITTSDQIKNCYELLQKTYQLAHVFLVGRPLFEAAFDVLHPKEMVKFTLARVGEVCVAVSVELLYKEIMYGWYGGVDRAYAQYYPNELLMWHLFQWGLEHNYCVYDFGGAGKPDEEYGVRDFKAKFGGNLMNFGRNILVHSPTRLKLSKLGYSLYRRYL